MGTVSSSHMFHQLLVPPNTLSQHRRVPVNELAVNKVSPRPKIGLVDHCAISNLVAAIPLRYVLVATPPMTGYSPCANRGSAGYRIFGVKMSSFERLCCWIAFVMVCQSLAKSR
jgi:hypothetical protein